MYTFTVNMRTVRWKEEGLINEFTLLKSTRKKGEGVWTPTYKLALLQLFETEDIFSR